MTEQLATAVTRFVERQPGESPFATAIAGLTILRWHDGKHPSHVLHTPALCLVVQGAKETMFGDTRLTYRTGEAMVVTVDLPGFSQIIEVDARQPYLSIIIALETATMREVLAGFDTQPVADREAFAGAFVTDCRGPLEDCVLRAMHLLDTPAAIPVLYPGILREICYRLLAGPHGGEVAKIARASAHPGVVGAVAMLRDHFLEPLRIDALAAASRLSPSAFHRQFKALTAMTPLQYQKQLRLMEARRMMLSDGANVEAAAFRSGCASPSQFSREYTRMFGTSPRRDVAAIRAAS